MAKSSEKLVHPSLTSLEYSLVCFIVEIILRSQIHLVKVNKHSKTIFIQNIDGECRPLDIFTECLVENIADMKEIYEQKGSALYKLGQPNHIVTKSNQLIEGGKYSVISPYDISFSHEGKRI